MGLQWVLCGLCFYDIFRGDRDLKNKKLVVALAGIVILMGVIYVAMNFAEKPAIVAKVIPTLSDEVKSLATHHSVIYVTLFDEATPMPYAAMREVISVGPEGKLRDLFVTEEKIQVMNPSRPRPSSMRLKVRLDADGSAGPDQPGDITGETRGVTWGQDAGVQVLLDKFIVE
jgi:hypothetical protein